MWSNLSSFSFKVNAFRVLAQRAFTTLRTGRLHLTLPSRSLFYSTLLNLFIYYRL